jgi:hypothetical protein
LPLARKHLVVDVERAVDDFDALVPRPAGLDESSLDASSSSATATAAFGAGPL